MNQFSDVVTKLSEAVQKAVQQHSSQTVTLSKQATSDQSMNIVISGIPEDKDSSVWREAAVVALRVATGRDVNIDDAFRIGGRFSAG